jgi:hypothetical protein
MLTAGSLHDVPFRDPAARRWVYGRDRSQTRTEPRPFGAGGSTRPTAPRHPSDRPGVEGVMAIQCGKRGCKQ